MRQYRKYNKEDIIKYAKEVYSIAGLLKALDLRAVGGNYKTIKKYLQLYNVDTSHWTGQGWNKEIQQKNWSEYKKTSSLRRNLINEKGYQCEKCKNTKWNGEDIPLEVHHIDGDNTNNEYENLQLLCCNCHAQTPNWRSRKIKNEDSCKNKYIRPKNGKCINCEKPIEIRNKRCKLCEAKRKKLESGIPLREELIVKKEEFKSFIQLGKYYGVSDNTIRKWFKKYNII